MNLISLKVRRLFTDSPEEQQTPNCPEVSMDENKTCELLRKPHRRDSCSSVESFNSDHSKQGNPHFKEEPTFSSDEDEDEKDETSLLAAQQSEDKDGMKTSWRQQPAASAAC